MCVCFLLTSSFGTKVKRVHKLVDNYVRTLYIEYSILIIIKQSIGLKHTDIANVQGYLKNKVTDIPMSRILL
jgi:hypothetical protein